MMGRILPAVCFLFFEYMSVSVYTPFHTSFMVHSFTMGLHARSNVTVDLVESFCLNFRDDKKKFLA